MSRCLRPRQPLRARSAVPWPGDAVMADKGGVLMLSPVCSLLAFAGARARRMRQTVKSRCRTRVLSEVWTAKLQVGKQLGAPAQGRNGLVANQQTTGKGLACTVAAESANEGSPSCPAMRHIARPGHSPPGGLHGCSVPD